ncbi:meiotic recombination protein REC8 homolog [Myxocyprinus asiaticus]|uniref:meiotic recombination protein REC8 homolog n=1 Tax=Myxocyprinus asiaticus TaxID=70543 RepID=UPI002223C482|nr:meiotic recombination protein REC8 homolog [Myxocyprinus asiaticus]
MDYVLVRVPPPASGLPRPRFSLYLSSQLQYGVVLVYHRQCGFLLEDTQGAIDRLLRLNRKANIDLMDEDTRQIHVLPDALALLDETEGARDPFFGVMDTGYGLPSPSSLIQQIREVLPEQAPPTREPTPPLDGITASQEAITLTEREPVTMPEPEFEGAELQESNMIELLLEQPDHFPEDGTKLGILFLGAQITGTSSQDVVLLPEEDFGLPMEMPVLEEREKTPVSVTLPLPSPLPSEEVEMVVEPRKEKTLRERSPSLEPAVVTPEFPKVQRKRRRQLLFFDEDTQISQEEMRAQIDDVEIETRPLTNVLIKPPFEKSDAKALLGNPCMKLKLTVECYAYTGFPPEILALWKQAAVVRPIPPSEFLWDVPVEEEIPEREEERHEPEERELISKEIPREMVESGLSQQETPASFVVLETTDKDFSPLETPESRRSPVPEIQYSLEDIQEERIPEMEEISVDTEEPVRPLFAVEGLVTFHSLLPPQASRRIVAQIFWALLEKTVAKQITVRQDEPYGDIIISQVQPLII